MAEGRDKLVVHVDAPELDPNSSVGVLQRERGRSGTVISFAYDDAWLARADAFTLDPSLGLYPGPQFVTRLPGIFTDAAPDRWGRTLLERREAIAARAARRAPRRLDDWDFLVGVNDRVRMGALRLARAGDGVFVDDEPLIVPPFARLRELEHWARAAEAGVPRAGSDAERWLALLLAPGSSLGGARPKASFLAEDGTLWMAKFPSREDQRDVGAWEHVATTLAAKAGIAVPETRLLRLGQTHRTFAARRFDRVNADRRLYALAMTLAGSTFAALYFRL
ncbi:MAG: HipA domain-containing protein, partial [Chloroflexota bacterium]